MQIRYLKKKLQEAKKKKVLLVYVNYTRWRIQAFFFASGGNFFFSEKGWDKIQIEIVLDHTFINLTV